MAAAPPAADGDEGGYRPMAEINVTPLVDVMLVLLVIFMVAAPLMTVGVPVELPKTQAERVARVRTPVIVTLDRQGRVFVGEREVAAADLSAHLSALAQGDGEATVYVRGDRSLPYGDVMRLMGAVSGAGFARVSLLAEAMPAAKG